jgi:hypothetical protein
VRAQAEVKALEADLRDATGAHRESCQHVRALLLRLTERLRYQDAEVEVDRRQAQVLASLDAESPPIILVKQECVLSTDKSARSGNAALRKTALCLGGLGTTSLVHSFGRTVSPRSPQRVISAMGCSVCMYQVEELQKVRLQLEAQVEHLAAQLSEVDAQKARLKVCSTAPCSAYCPSIQQRIIFAGSVRCFVPCLPQEEVTDLKQKCDSLDAEVLAKAAELSEAVRVSAPPE